MKAVTHLNPDLDYSYTGQGEEKTGASRISTVIRLQSVEVCLVVHHEMNYFRMSSSPLE